MGSSRNRAAPLQHCRNRALVDLARHYGFQSEACRFYPTKAKGEVERPFSYILEDFFLTRFSATAMATTLNCGTGWTASRNRDAFHLLPGP